MTFASWLILDTCDKNAPVLRLFLGVGTGLANRWPEPSSKIERKNMKNKITLLAAFLATASAYATPTDATLFFWDNTGATATVTDGLLGDANPNDGKVTFLGGVGANWTLLVDTGTSKPLNGSPAHPLMDLNFDEATSKGAGTLSVAFFDNKFGPSGTLGALASIGGTLPPGATLTYQTFTRAGDAAPTFSSGALDLSTLAGWSLLTSQTFPFVGPGGSFSGDASSLGMISGGASDYSLVQVITITVNSASQTTGNAKLQAPDGGMTLMLLGSSLTALAFLRRSLKLGKA